jgi:vacuolar iron transporter family protein
LALKMGLAHESHPHPTFLSDFILGSQDGLVNVLGILLGLSAAAAEYRVILIATLAALAAEAISMGAVAYTSTLARRSLYVAELEREQREIREVPDAEREEVRVILRKWGYEGEDLEEMLRRIEAKPKAWLDLMMAFELNLSEVSPDQPRNSALLVFSATIVGSLIPLLPFLVVHTTSVANVIASVVLSGAALFVIGAYESRVTVGSLWKSGSRMLLIGLAAGFAGFLVGHFAAGL